MRLATWNVNSVIARLPRLVDWVDRAAPDVLCLQETKCPDDTFPAGPLRDRGYQVAAHGDGRWNGVAVASRIGLSRVARGFPGQPPWVPPATEVDPALFDAPVEPLVEARAVLASCGPLRVCCVYVPNGRVPGSPHFEYKLRWLAALGKAVQAELDEHEQLVVCGDFNVAPTDEDVWDPAAFVGSTHVTGPEREAVQRLQGCGLTDVVPRPLKYHRGFTYWDYRAGMFHKNMGMRIDLVLASQPVAEKVEDAWVDREARKGSGPSDHAPVVVDLGEG